MSSTGETNKYENYFCTFKNYFELVFALYRVACVGFFFGMAKKFLKEKADSRLRLEVRQN